MIRDSIYDEEHIRKLEANARVLMCIVSLRKELGNTSCFPQMVTRFPLALTTPTLPPFKVSLTILQDCAYKINFALILRCNVL